MEWDDLNLEEKYSATKAYLQSKLANVLFTVQLAHKLEGCFNKSSDEIIIINFNFNRL